MYPVHIKEDEERFGTFPPIFWRQLEKKEKEKPQKKKKWKKTFLITNI